MLSTKKKIIVTSILMTVISLTFVFTTFAYFTDILVADGQTIFTGTASAEIINKTVIDGEEIPSDQAIRIMPGYSISKTVTAKSTGSLPVYIRIKLAPEILLSQKEQGRENEIDLSLISYDIDETHWQYKDGYYYYLSPLTKGNTAPNLFTTLKFSEEMGNLYKDSQIKLTVRIEVVQAGGNAGTSLDAVGWVTPSSTGGNA